MPKVVVSDRAGMSSTIETNGESTLMEVIRDNGFDDLQALCGGQCACATCHVYIGEAWLDRLPPRSEEETDLLDGVDLCTPASRLSCQIELTDELDGIEAQIAPE